MDKKRRDEFIMKYAPLVKNIVERISARLPSHSNVKEDLINVGLIGLISSIEKFDKKRNVRFETYASFRIRGAVLDELRARDW
ncbi:MAG TPA: sigma-70 family RNA polymerase sigma factor, partial [Syntrophales bacterium]